MLSSFYTKARMLASYYLYVKSYKSKAKLANKVVSKQRGG